MRSRSGAEQGQAATAIMLVHRAHGGGGHFDLILPPVYAERAMAMGSTKVAWVSATAWSEAEASA